MKLNCISKVPSSLNFKTPLTESVAVSEPLKLRNNARLPNTDGSDQSSGEPPPMLLARES